MKRGYKLLYDTRIFLKIGKKSFAKVRISVKFKIPVEIPVKTQIPAGISVKFRFQQELRLADWQ